MKALISATLIGLKSTPENLDIDTWWNAIKECIELLKPSETVTKIPSSGEKYPRQPNVISLIHSFQKIQNNLISNLNERLGV